MQTASYGMPFAFIAFFGIIFIDNNLLLNCCISIKLSRIVWLINVHILVCQHANMTADYGRFSVVRRFYRNFI